MPRDITFPWAFTSTAFCRGDGIPLLDEATSVAVEHCAWATANGDTPAMVMRSVGFVPRVPLTGWDDAIAAVGRRWFDLLGARPAVREAA